MSTHNDDGKKASGTDAATNLWDELGFVTASQYREAVLLALTNGPDTPSGLTPDEVDMGHISRAISDLREEDLVELLVSEDTRKGRYYGLTDRGEDVAAKVQEVNA